MAEKEDHRELLKRAVAAVQDLRARLQAEEQKSREPIAIIGIGCRFPAGADSPEGFWNLVDKGIDAVSEIPSNRFPIDSYYDPNPDVPGKIATRRGAFLNEIDKFDAEFFGISPREATQMDPQQRMLLEVSWEGLEDAGQTLARLARSSTGVFVGAITADYMWRQLDDPDCIDAYSGTGTHSSILSGRVSHFLDLRGPSMTLDTACSSSLVAVHLACQSLRQRESDLALAAGVNLVTSPVSLMAYSRMGLLAPDGLCKTFDSLADGFVGGEGCGVVVLKRLSDAVADGDSIRAVIRGSAVNQDGKSSTLTAPNGPSQEDVVARSLANAGIPADRVTYVEAHGTGTALGDPIELEALKAVLDVGTDTPRCAVGSVKTNIGHLGAAAGIAGLIKVVLALQHRTIPSHLHFRRLNPHISLEDSRLFVPVERLDWTDSRGPLTAGVSSFGWSGTNAHVILEATAERETPATQNSTSAAEMHLLPLSARSPHALEELARAYSRTLLRDEFVSPALLHDVCYTAGVRRTHHKNRIAVVGQSAKQLVKELNQIDGARPGEDLLKHGVAFVFCGQGAQWAGMGQELYGREKVFRLSLDESDAAIRRKASWSILDKIELDNTRFAQPAIFALQVALARLWQSWGIEPSVVVGHSVGEIAAAHISGVLSLEDAVTVALSRAARMEASTGKGTMAEVELRSEEATRVVAEFPQVTIAAYNSPNSVVLAGETSALEAAMESLRTRGIHCTRLHVKYAFHTSQMEPYVDPLIRDLQDLKRQPASLPFFSTVHGGAGLKDDFSAQYWGRNIREPVLFAEAIRNMISAGHRMFLELGPHPVLSPAILTSLESRNAAGAAVASLHRKRSERGSMLGALGTLYGAGASVRFKNITPVGSPVQPLPAYPWQRKRFWLEVASARATALKQPKGIGSYEIVWERVPTASASNLDAAVRRTNWILFEDPSGQSQGLSSALSKRIGEIGAFCARAVLGSDLNVAFQERSGEWNVLFVCPESAPASAIQLTEDALVLVQSCLEARQKIKLWTVTRGAQPPNGGRDRTGLAHAPITGLGRVLAIELPQIWGGSVDVAPGPEDHCNSVLSWITSNSPETEVAINASGTYTPRLSESAVTLGDTRLAVRSDKSYLITGGLGGVGIAVARVLVANGARHLMLFGRGEPSEAAAAAIKEMENLDVTCSLHRGDVTVRRDLSDAFSAFGDTLPELAGIVHAAGVVRDAMIPSITREQLRRVLSPKVAGAWNLHEVAGDRPLDFFVMFSSLSSVLGSAGQASYSAANAFLDRLAHYRQALGLRGLTINWGPWADTGMTSQLSDVVRARWAEQGITPFSPSQGAEMFMQLAGTRAIQRAAVIMDWERFRDSRAAASPIIRNLAGAAAGRDSSAVVENALDQFRRTAVGERGQWMSEWIRRKVARILKTDESELAFERNLLEMGFDSLMVMELLRVIGRELQIRTYPREFYERPSIHSFATYLSQEIEPQSAGSLPPIMLQSSEGRVEGLPGRAGNRLEIPAVFLLSAPRSGSTLLRVMLAGHPSLFCPPELHLLGFTTMGARKSGLRGSYLEEGLVRAIQELDGGSAEKAVSLEQDWVSADLPVEEVYDRLQKMAKGRLLIDKSPSYAARLDTLKNAEELFVSAKYIHLVRHPLSVIDSFVKNRFDRLLGLTGKAPGEVAEKVWVESNANLSEFLRSVDPGRSMTIRYEDLVRSPQAVMEELCFFLGVPFDAAVLQPYEGRRMTDGLRSQSIAIGDPGFLEHKGIDASLADAWQNVTDPASLGQEALTMAAGFRYEIPPSKVVETPMTEQYIDVRGLSLCLCSWGPPGGRPIFIVHGVLDHGAAWEEVAVSLAKRGCRVFVPDQRGHGRSQHAGADGSYHLMDFLADADTLLRQVSTTPVTVVGHSMGATIAAMLTAARPELVSRLILVESILGSDRSPRSSSDALSTHLNALEIETKPQTFPDTGAAAERLREFYPSMDKSRAMKMAARLVEPCREGVRWRWDERIRSRAGLAYHGTFDLDAGRFLSILKEVQVPVTLVLGTNSELVSREQAARQLKELSNGREVMLRGGHNLHVECPVELADVIGSW